MAKTQNKTTETVASVPAFINAVDDETKRDDSRRLIKLMQELTGEDARMWGASIVGFGTYHYKYASGREGDAPLVGFSPRRNEISIYLNTEFPEKSALLEKFGKHRAGAGCIYVKKLADIDEAVLSKLITASVKSIQKMYPTK